MNTYKKLASGNYGAWIDTGYGKTAIAKPTPGETVKISTKAGETHTRVIAKIIKDYASGVLVSLVADAQVAAVANERYKQACNTKSASNVLRGVNDICRLCGSYCYGDCTAS